MIDLNSCGEGEKRGQERICSVLAEAGLKPAAV